MVANGNIKEYALSTQFSKEMRLIGEHWSFIHPCVSIPPTVTEFDFGANNSVVLQEALEPRKKQLLEGGDLG